MAARRSLVLAWLTATAAGSILAAALPLLVGRSFDQVLREGTGLSVLLPAAALILGSQLARALVGAARLLVVIRLAADVEADIRISAYRTVMRRPAEWHATTRIGELTAHLFNDVRQIRTLIYPAGDNLVNSWGFLAVALILAPFYSPSLVAAPALYLVGYTFIVRRLIRSLTASSRQMRKAFGDLNGEASEMLRALPAIRAAGLEAHWRDRFLNAASKSRDATVDQAVVEAKAPLFLLLGIVQAAGFGHALLLLTAGQLAPGAVVGYLGLLLMLGFPTFSALSAYPPIAEGRAAAERIQQLTTPDQPATAAIGSWSGPMRAEVELDDVSFRYPDGTCALRSVDLTLACGQIHAVVGGTGSGKSTLALLIVGLFTPTTGEVRIDGRPLRQWRPDALGSHIAFVPQDTAVFRDTLRGNILLGRSLPEPALHAAVTAAHLDFVGDLRHGLDTPLGPPSGADLSGGQRQRLALARALAADPALLVLDDSTSALDADTEERLRADLLTPAAGRTIVLITSRPSIALQADTVVVLRHGQVIAHCTPRDLPAHPDMYVRSLTRLK